MEELRCPWCKTPCSMIEYKKEMVVACDKYCAKDYYYTWPKIEAVLTLNYDKMREFGMITPIFDHELLDILAERKEREEKIAGMVFV